MKKTAKFLVVLVVVALMTSALAVLAFADADCEEIYENIKEYYDGVIHVNATFDESGELEGGSDAFFVIGDLSVSEIKNGCLVTNGNVSPIIFKAEPAELATAMGINAGVLFGSDAGKVKIVVYNESGAPLVILETANDGKIKVADGNANFSDINTLNYPVSDAPLDVASDNYFKAEAYLENTAAGVKITTKLSAAGNYYTYEAEIAGFKAAALSFVNCENEGAVSIDFLEIYESDFAHRLNDNEAEIGIKLVELGAYLENGGNAALKNSVAELICALTPIYGYDTAKIADAALKEQVEQIISSAYQSYASVDAESLVAAAGKINTSAAYPDRVKLLSDNAAYVKIAKYMKNAKSDVYLSVNVDGCLDNAVAALEAEAAALDSIAAKTQAGIAYAESIKNYNNANYAALKEYNDVLAAYSIDATYVDAEGGYDAERVTAAVAVASEIAEMFTRIDNSAKTFVKEVALASNTGKTFETRYYAYMRAKASYYVDKSYTPEGFDDMDEVLAAYSLVEDYIDSKTLYNDVFIAAITNAKATLSFSVRLEKLAEAEQYLDLVEMVFPEIQSAYETYNALLEAVENKKLITVAYIQAVMAISDATTNAEKSAAIEAARVLAAEGSDVSVNVTVDGIDVSTANVIFSNADMSLKLYNAENNNYLDAVAAIAKATTLAERRAAIYEASARKDKADAERSDVVAANAALESAIEKYNSDIAASNAAADEVNEVAANAVGGTTASATIYKFVAIVKKFFE